MLSATEPYTTLSGSWSSRSKWTQVKLYVHLVQIICVDCGLLVKMVGGDLTIMLSQLLPLLWNEIDSLKQMLCLCCCVLLTMSDKESSLQGSLHVVPINTEPAKYTHTRTLSQR